MNGPRPCRERLMEELAFVHTHGVNEMLQKQKVEQLARATISQCERLLEENEQLRIRLEQATSDFAVFAKRHAQVLDTTVPKKQWV